MPGSESNAPNTSLPYTVVDAFTTSSFSGNPAAVVITDAPLADAMMQLVAREFNLAETAFVSPLPSTEPADPSAKFKSGLSREYALRWFTPSIEVDLCGHATLASAHVLFSAVPDTPLEELQFHTKSGILVARRNKDLKQLEISLPAGLAEPLSPEESVKAHDVLVRALGKEVAQTAAFVGRGQNFPFRHALLVELQSAQNSSAWLSKVDVKPAVFMELAPTFDIAIVTTRPPQADGPAAAASEQRFDFISRVFAPAVGIPEDPVTGFAHCLAGPYWHQKLHSNSTDAKTVLRAHQASARGGDVDVLWNEKEGRCTLRGHAVTAARGELFLLPQ